MAIDVCGVGIPISPCCSIFGVRTAASTTVGMVPGCSWGAGAIGRKDACAFCKTGWGGMGARSRGLKGRWSAFLFAYGGRPFFLGGGSGWYWCCGCFRGIFGARWLFIWTEGAAVVCGCAWDSWEPDDRTLLLRSLLGSSPGAFLFRPDSDISFLICMRAAWHWATVRPMKLFSFEICTRGVWLTIWQSHVKPVRCNTGESNNPIQCVVVDWAMLDELN